MNEIDRDRSVPQHHGKYAGVVVDNGPPPGGGGHRGELKVRVPGILEETPGGTGNQAIVVLAAPAFLPGCFIVPDVGAQVWVEFVAGDINHPIWTGTWYPDGKVPSAAGGDAATENHKVIRTRSGQTITFDDTDGNEKTVIKDEKHGNTVMLDQGGITIEATGASITLKLGQSTITMKSDSIEIAQGATHKIEMTSEGVALTDSVGSLQGAVLAPILDWLLSHQHVGNMGAPTPLFPADLAKLNLLKPTLVSKGG